MRNIFDQYRHPENRLTHALVSSLASDPALLTSFIKWASAEKPPASKLEILEQRLPGEEEPRDEEEAERRGLPDAWIHDGNGWALIIESKIASQLTAGQLKRHRATTERRGFSRPILVALVTESPSASVANGNAVSIRKWTEVYCWLKQQKRHSEWANRASAYMEILERKLVQDDYLKEGTLTVFSGISFGNDEPYNYPEAKRLLRLALDELQKRRDLKTHLGMDSEGKGRSAITGRESTRVWDFLPLVHAKEADSFTEFPHLTLSIQQERLLTIVTVPDGIRREFRKRLLANGRDRFYALFQRILDNLKQALGSVEGAAPWIEVIQRHYDRTANQGNGD